MKIVVNDLAASHSGAMTILKSLYNYVRENDEENEYVFLLSGKYLEETERIRIMVLPQVKKGWIHKLYFDMISGKKVLVDLQADRVISLQNIITFGYKGIQDVYVQQSIPFQDRIKFSFCRKRERIFAIYQYIIGAFIKLSTKKARNVYVQTKWMKNAIIKKAKISTERVFVIPPDVEALPALPYLFTANRFFYPASFENIYKNQDCIYRAAEIIKRKGLEDFQIYLTLNRNHAERTGCDFIGYLDKNDLFKMYSSSVLVFPSFIETVGLPLVEARECGAVILSADCEYAHEILENYPNAYFFDPNKPEELAALMEQVLRGEIRCHKVTCVSKKNESPSNWKNMVEMVMKA